MWRDHRVKSARWREKGVGPISAWMNEKRSRWSTLMHHCQPRPSVRTRSFNNSVQKGRWEWNHPSFTKVYSSTLLPPRGHLKYLFQKKEKNGGYFNNMPETFCQREIEEKIDYRRKAWIAVRWNEINSCREAEKNQLSPWGMAARLKKISPWMGRGCKAEGISRKGRSAHKRLNTASKRQSTGFEPGKW